MTKEEALEKFKELNVDAGEVSLWVLKKSSSFTARSVLITDELKQALLGVIKEKQGRFTEVLDYSLLAQNNEVSLLALGVDETAFDVLRDKVDLPAAENQITGVKDIENAVGYVVRVRVENDVLYCLKKTDAYWSTKKASNSFNAIVNGNQLDLQPNRSLSFANRFDFFVIGDQALVDVKANFESLMGFKLLYQNSFATLNVDPVFVGAFTSTQLLVEHVGTNTMHLRRMEVVRQKALYANPQFMQRLREVSANRNWNIQFDQDGKIVPTAESVRSILQVLLNHRLLSELTLEEFDVPSAVPVAV